MAFALKQRKRARETAAEQVVRRLDALPEDEHARRIDEARQRTEAKRQERRERARVAAARLRDAS